MLCGAVTSPLLIEGCRGGPPEDLTPPETADATGMGRLTHVIAGFCPSPRVTGMPHATLPMPSPVVARERLCCQSARGDDRNDFEIVTQITLGMGM